MTPLDSSAEAADAGKALKKKVIAEMVNVNDGGLARNHVDHCPRPSESRQKGLHRGKEPK